MKVLSWNGPKKIEIEEQPFPHLKEEEVLIQVEVVGICGSEIEGYLGHNSLRKPPLIMGHEFSGIVVKRGSAVQGIKKGEKVTVNPLIGCGNCRSCQSGLENLCTKREIIGIHRQGAFSEFVAVPANNVHVLPDDFNLYQAALAEPLACAYRAVKRAFDYEQNESAFIFGAGTIGLLSGLVAQYLGADPIIIADINEERLETAKRIGLTHTMNPSKDAVNEQINQITNQKGIDIVVDAVGFETTRKQAEAIINPGGVIMNIGLGIDESYLPVNNFIRNEVTQLGSFCYTKDDFVEAVSLLKEGKITYEGWTEVRDMEEGNRAFLDLINGSVNNGKIFLKIKGRK